MTIFVYNFTTGQVVGFGSEVEAALYLCAEAPKYGISSNVRTQNLKVSILRSCDEYKKGRMTTVYDRWWACSAQEFPEVTREMYLNASYATSTSYELVNQYTGERIRGSKEVKDFISKNNLGTFAHLKYALFADLGYTPFDGYYVQYFTDPKVVPVAKPKNNQVVKAWAEKVGYNLDYRTLNLRIKKGSIVKPTFGD